jgi:hypothetical protein
VNQTTGLTFNLVKGACDALVQIGAQYLETMLINLDSTPDSFSIGTKMPCKMSDMNNDMKVDAWGKESPVEERCKWDVVLSIGGSVYDPQSSFWASEKK